MVKLRFMSQRVSAQSLSRVRLVLSILILLSALYFPLILLAFTSSHVINIAFTANFLAIFCLIGGAPGLAILAYRERMNFDEFILLIGLFLWILEIIFLALGFLVFSL